MIFLVFFQTFVLVGILAAVLLVLHKTRKIHLATYRLLQAGWEAETLFSQIQSLFALERKLSLDQALPPMRRWAGSPDFLLRVADEILARKPVTVMECSSGVSTLVIARCLQIIGRGHVYSLEHDLEYANKTRGLLSEYRLSEWATVIDAPLESTDEQTPWYSEHGIPVELPPIDFLAVDGPPATVGPLARYPALPRLAGRMATQAVVIADDTNRADETEMIKRWHDLYPNSHVIDCHCEKGCMLLSYIPHDWRAPRIPIPRSHLKPVAKRCRSSRSSANCRFPQRCCPVSRGARQGCCHPCHTNRSDLIDTAVSYNVSDDSAGPKIARDHFGTRSHSLGITGHSE